MSSHTGLEDSGHRRWRFLLAAKVAVVVGLLLLANLAVGWAGLRAVAVTDRQADRLYSESLQQVRDQDNLSRALDQAYQDTLRLIPTNVMASQGEIERRLDDVSIPAVERALAAVEREEADEEPAVRALVQRVRDGWQRFLKLRHSGKFEVTGYTRQVALFNDALVKKVAGAFEPILTALDQLTETELRDAQQAHDRADSTHRSSRFLIVVILVGSLAAAMAVGIWLTRNIVGRIRDYAAFATKVTDGAGTRPLHPRGSDELAGLGQSLNQMLARQQANARAAAAQAEFIEMLQVTVGEEEAHDLVKRHLERSIGDSGVVVLNRNNSADRLEPVTALAPDSPLVAALDGATPRSCLALRFARTHQEDPTRPPLVACQLCAVTGRSTCEPLLVGGEVIGSVLVQHPQPLSDDDTERIKDSVSQAAPVLANQRNLALAEFRANNDALTGVPNKRALHDTLKRMVAQAARSVSPLAAIMLDLDPWGTEIRALPVSWRFGAA